MPDADFAAAFAEGEDFAGVERRIGVERVVDAAHEGEVGVREEEGHELGFFHADAVFTGQRAANFNAMADDFGGCLKGAFELFFVAGIEEHNGMQVAVAGVENIADLKAVLIADLADAAQSLGKFGTRDHTVEDVVAGGQAAEGTESVFAAFPKKVAFGIVAGEPNFAGTMGVAHFGDGRSLRGDSFGKAFDLDEKNGSAVRGKTGVDVVFDSGCSPLPT